MRTLVSLAFLAFLVIFPDEAILAEAVEPSGENLARSSLPELQEVTGTVVAAGSLRPLAGAQVLVDGSDRGTLTDGRGAFRIDGLTGTHVTIRVVYIGYRTQTQQVEVGGDPVRILMAESPLELDAISVTGTAGGQRTRAMGNTVGRVDVGEVLQTIPATNLQQMLSAQIPGVRIMTNQGEPGAGGATRVRGAGSISLSNEPLVYVDGIRVDNNPATGAATRLGPVKSRISDINPEDIEQIEFIKGPAAATLYGTEATNGVLNITTKRGVTGTPTVDMRIRQGANFLTNPEGRFPSVFARDGTTGELIEHNVVRSENERGTPIFATGHAQGYGVSVRGGVDQLQYFVSGDFNRDEGIVPWENWDSRLSTRANVRFAPSDRWAFDTNLSFVRGSTKHGTGSSIGGGWELLGQINWGHPNNLGERLRGMRSAPPEALATIEALSSSDRFIGGVEIRHDPVPWYTHRLKVGGDIVNDASSVLFPRHPEGDSYYFGANSLGIKQINRTRSSHTTLDYGGTLTYGLSQSFRAETAFGTQYFFKQLEQSGATGRLFPAPAVTTISAAAVISGSEDYLENKTFGVFLQQQLSWKDRFFVTLGARGDDNSAFGEDFDFAVYPKAQATWVVSEEAWWRSPEVLNNLRIRTAWGRAGMQPDVFAAARLYDATTGPGDGSTVTPGAVGNPELKPEVSDELEFGFDASLWDERIGVEFTYYNQTTRDAIIARTVPPSSGFGGSQFVNLGETNNRGIEVGLGGRVLDRAELAWDIQGNISTNRNEVLSLGGLPPLSSVRSRTLEGYPINGFWYPRIVSAELDSEGLVTNVMCDGGEANNHEPIPCGPGNPGPQVYWGSMLPAWEGGVSSTWTIRGNLQLMALVDFIGGYYKENADAAARGYFFNNTRAYNERTDPIYMAYIAQSANSLGFYDAGMARLRDVSATYTLPTGVSESFGLSRSSVTVSGRNLAFLWRAQATTFGDEPILDPEVNAIPTTGVGGAASQSRFPLYASLGLTMRLTF